MIATNSQILQTLYLLKRRPERIIQRIREKTMICSNLSNADLQEYNKAIDAFFLFDNLTNKYKGEIK